MQGTLKPPTIPAEEKSPFVIQLAAFMEHQGAIIQKQAEEIQQLKDEIARIKNQTPRPDIKPSSLGKKKKSKTKNSKTKRPGSKKRHKTAQLEIHDTKPVEPEHIPDGSEFRYYKSFVVQDLKIEAHNIRYRLKVYETPEGGYISGQLPEYLNGGHFGSVLIRFILYQYHHCHVTQPLLLEQLYELGIDISKGQLSNILIENKDRYHKEKDSILAVGLQVSSYINVDDTGARHQGKNGYCTHIGNESFSWFESTASKSRINFLKLMRAGHSDCVINMDAICYMQYNKLPLKLLEAIIKNKGMIFANDEQWDAFLAQSGIAKNRHVQIATEGVLIGSIIERGLSKDLNTVKDQVWQLYEGLKAYKQNPRSKDKNRLEKMFNKIFTRKTTSATLNAALKRIYNNKSELLLVLERPDIPLHNNSAENAIREYVKKRKISGSTRSEAGRQCRDTFTSLKKTCRKLGISFRQYLKDRIENTGYIPNLSDLVRDQALNPG